MTSTYNTGNPRCLPAIERLNELFYLQDESILIRRGSANSPSPVGADGKQNTVHIDGDNFVIPRIIYKMQTGVEPMGVVRHLNDDASDNSPSNLADGSQRVNCEERSVNSLGADANAIGVDQHRSGRWRWTFSSQVHGKVIGTCDTKEQAIAERAEQVTLHDADPHSYVPNRQRSAGSGYRWVYANDGGWKGCFNYEGERIHCGTHQSPEDAYAAVLVKRQELGLD